MGMGQWVSKKMVGSWCQPWKPLATGDRHPISMVKTVKTWKTPINKTTRDQKKAKTYFNHHIWFPLPHTLSHAFNSIPAPHMQRPWKRAGLNGLGAMFICLQHGLHIAHVQLLTLYLDLRKINIHGCFNFCKHHVLVSIIWCDTW